MCRHWLKKRPYIYIGTLNVFLVPKGVESNSTSGRKHLWSLQGEQGRFWQHALVPFSSNGNNNNQKSFQIQIEGLTKGGGLWGDTTIDDVLLETKRSTNCKLTPPYATVEANNTDGTPSTPTDAGNVQFECDFESDDCGFVNSNQLEWRRTSVLESSIGSDHTLGKQN